MKSLNVNICIILIFLCIKIDLFAQNEIKIGDQIWSTQNLNVDKFRNGDPIPQAKTEQEWEKAYFEMRPAWCYYNNDPINSKKYGKLYNWYALNDPRGLAPKGWHIPNDMEWFILVNFIDTAAKNKNHRNFTNGFFWESKIAALSLKSATGWKDNGTSGRTEVEICGICSGKGKKWSSISKKYITCAGCGGSGGEKFIYQGSKQTGGGNNNFGFSALPGGSRSGNLFSGLLEDVYFWSSTEINVTEALVRSLGYYSNNVTKWIRNKGQGFSIRCVKE